MRKFKKLAFITSLFSSVALCAAGVASNRFNSVGADGVVYESTVDKISISDLKIGGKSVGGKIDHKTATVYTYDKTAPYGSIEFSFKLKTVNWTDKGHQIHLGSGWQEEGCFWIRSDNSIICNTGEKVADSLKYAKGGTCGEGTHTFVLSRKAIMNGSAYSGNCELSISIDGEEKVKSTTAVASDLLTNNYLTIRGDDEDIFLDMDFAGNTITYKVPGEEDVVVNNYMEDYLTQPQNPVVPEGKRFLGWFTAKGERWDFEHDQVPGDLTLVAGFETIQDVDDETYFDDSTFTPVLRFLVSSDTHIVDAASERRDTNLANMFKTAYEFGEKHATYKDLDAALVVGDLTDGGSASQMAKFNTLCTTAIGAKETELIVSLGNHDIRQNAGVAEQEALFEETFNHDVDYSTKINGFWFIALSPNSENGEHFLDGKADWLDSELAKCAADTPDKPIFVMQHEGIKDTVYGSHDWGVDDGLLGVLSKYPQVVDFSGHSHYPLIDPRSIWQGSFTAFGTGTLNYYEMGINNYKTSGVFPSDKNGGWNTQYHEASQCAEYQIVEIDANNAMRVTGYDLMTNKEITHYYLRNLMDNMKVKYSHEERSKDVDKPAFENGATLTATVDQTTINLKFPQAKGDTLVESYRIEVYKGGSLKKTEYALSDYFFDPMPTEISFDVKYLDQNSDYTFKVYAVNVWGEESEACITTTAKTGKLDLMEDHIDEISLSDLYYNGVQLTTDTAYGFKDCTFNKSANNNYGSYKLTVKFLYMGGDFQYYFNKKGPDQTTDNQFLLWINNGNDNIWYVHSGFKSAEPLEKGLHTFVFERHAIVDPTSPDAGKTYLAFHVDGVEIFHYIDDQTYDNTGHIYIGGNKFYENGGRYYDIDAEIPTVTTPTFIAGEDFVLDEPLANWKRLGGVLRFYSPSSSLNFWLEDEDGAVSSKLTLEGQLTLGDQGVFYAYEVKTNLFKVLSGKEETSVTKICCDTAGFKWADPDFEAYAEESFEPFDEISVFDIVLDGENSGVLTNVSNEEPPRSYAGTSPTYSVVFSCYIATGDLVDGNEFRIQVGTIWKYFCTLWMQPNAPETGYFGFQYKERPTDRYAVNIKPNSIYKLEMATKRVADGEHKGENYTYFMLNDVEIVGFYVSADQCRSTDYQISYKFTGGYSIADLSLIRTINFVSEGTTYETKQAISGLKTSAPAVDPVKEGWYFCGWFESEDQDAAQVDFNKVFLADDPVTTYYARFTDEFIDIEFYDDEGTLLDTHQVGKNCHGYSIADPVKTGDVKYDFVKWVIKDTDIEYDPLSIATEPLEIEAVFEEHKYEIRYLVDGVKTITRYYVESDPSVIIGGEPDVPSIKGATGYWDYHLAESGEYEDCASRGDIYAVARYNGTATSAGDKITLDAFSGATVDIADDLTRYYLSFADTDLQGEWLQTYPVEGGHERQDITFSWSDSSKDSNYYVFFADNEEFENAFIVKTNARSINYVGIFTPGETYYWKVCGVTNNTWSAVDTFTVLDTPVRWISADTVFNMRDLGGWTTKDGTKQVTYGKIYRGGQLRLDNSGEKSYMTDYSHKVFDYLGMKTEIELRGDQPHDKNQFNDLENFLFVNGTGYLDFFRMGTGSKEYYRSAFATLADEANYPIYFHCSWGADRTGGLGFLINAVLGVPYERLVEDFELTSLSYSGQRDRKTTGFDAMYERFLSDYGDNTDDIQYAVSKFLTDFVGVPAAHLNALKAIMLEDAHAPVATHTVTYNVDGETSTMVVFDGAYASTVVPYYLDKHLAYWETSAGDEFDLSTPIHEDLVLTAVFEETIYDDYDVITIRDLGLDEGFTPSTTGQNAFTYEAGAASSNVMFKFNYEIVADDKGFDDGVQIEIGYNTWLVLAHIWIQNTGMSYIWVDGQVDGGMGHTTGTFVTDLIYGHTYEWSVGVITPLNGPDANKKLFVVLIDGVMYATYECHADLTQHTICFAGTEGKMYSIENNNTVTFYAADGTTKLGEKTVQRGQYVTTITAPEAPSGMKFLGFFDEYGQKWNFETSKVLKDIKLIAKFGDITVSASVLDDDDVAIIDSFEVKILTKVCDIELPIVDDSLTFVGWFNGDKKLKDSDLITGNMNLICRFTRGSQEPEPSAPESKGCGGSITSVFGLMSALSLAGVVLLKKKRQ